MDPVLQFAWSILMVGVAIVVWITPYVLIVLAPGLILGAGLIIVNLTMSWFPWNFVVEIVRWILICGALYLLYWSFSNGLVSSIMKLF